MTNPFVHLALGAAVATAAPNGLLPPGLYADRAGDHVYVGVENEQPDRTNQYYDPSNQHEGDVSDAGRYRLIQAIGEEKRVLQTPHGALGVSLYYAASGARPTIVLVHGNDPETRDMGFIIPYFVLNGVNVLSFDQRGTGQSAGDWLANGPSERARDVVAIYDAFADDSHVDATKIGVYAFSNGGWTAPVVTLQRHFAFMILHSGPTQTIRDNVDYEVMQELHRHGFGSHAVGAALGVWHAIEDALIGRGSWTSARGAYDDAKKQSWFANSLLPEFIKSVPPSPPAAAALKELLVFDPAAALDRLKTPTLALYGRLDRNVDAVGAASELAAYAKRSGLRDLTIVTYPNAGHQLIVSKSGYNGDPTPPARFVRGYPRIMIDWLRHRAMVAAP